VVNIELNDKVLTAIAEYINAKNEATKASFPVISVDNIVQPKVRDDSIVTLVDGGVKGLAKHIILYADLDLGHAYVDLEEEKPKPKLKQQVVSDRRKRGKK